MQKTTIARLVRARKSVNRALTQKARAAKRRAATKKPALGYVLYENANIVCVATIRTKNPKTGNMVQIWFLTRDIDPLTAVRTGQDDIICFDCKHRGNAADVISTPYVQVRKRTCYVQVRNAPQGVWRAYHRGRYEHLAVDGYRSVFTGRNIRFGAYGEPVLLPLPIVRALSTVANKRTGYTHQWQHAEYQEYRHYVMASVDSPAEYARATELGWRTFRCRTADQPLLPGEIICPASPEGNHKATCEKCGLCDGRKSPADVRKNIAIFVHGAAAKNFVSVDALTASAEVKLTGAERDAYIAQHFGRPADALVSIGGKRDCD